MITATRGGRKEGYVTATLWLSGASSSALTPCDASSTVGSHAAAVSVLGRGHARHPCSGEGTGVEVSDHGAVSAAKATTPGRRFGEQVELGSGVPVDRRPIPGPDRDPQSRHRIAPIAPPHRTYDNPHLHPAAPNCT